MDRTKELPVNVSVNERLYSVLIGSLLFTNAFRRKFSLTQAFAGGYMVARGLTGYCAIYGVAGRKELPDNIRNVNIKTSLVVGRPRHEVYAFWRNLKNLPLFMKHLESVEEVDNRISKWKANIPGGFGNLQWEAEITKERENEILGWNSLPGSTIENAGKVVFEDAGTNSTRVRVVISYHAPLGAAGETVARLFNALFESMVRDDISNFKQHMEQSRLSTIAGPSSAASEGAYKG